MKRLVTLVLLFISLISITSAVALSEVRAPTLSPGESGRVTLQVENDFSYDVDDVTVRLLISSSPFTTVGASEESEEEIREDDHESFSFEIKAPAGIEPGDYLIPYEIRYVDRDNEEIVREGSFGISVSAIKNLDYDVSTSQNIVGNDGEVTFQINNRGIGPIKFFTVTLLSAQGLEVFSPRQEYIGEIDSDDFETAIFDVRFLEENPQVIFFVEYTDFSNAPFEETLVFNLDVYTPERARELGLLPSGPSPTMIGLVVFVALVLLWYVLRRRKRKKRA